MLIILNTTAILEYLQVNTLKTDLFILLLLSSKNDLSVNAAKTCFIYSSVRQINNHGIIGTQLMTDI